MLVQCYFKELHEQQKVKGITLKERLFKWKQSQIYVLARKLCTKIMQEEHDVPMVGCHGERTARVVVGKKFYMPKMKQDVEHFIHIQKEIWTI
jgi:hypothetical protein